MSHQILHILTHGASLHKERGHLLFKPPDSPVSAWKRVALEDLRAIILCAKGVHFSSNVIAALQEYDVVMLHCNEHYAPVGITSPISHTTNLQVLTGQCNASEYLKKELWERLLTAKVGNQVICLDYLIAQSTSTCPILNRQDKIDKFYQESRQEVLSESLCARLYWQLYFPLLGWGFSRRDKQLENPPNIMLNYGYAIMTALCLRSLIAYGLIPQLGVFHKPRANSFPLAYDVVEPFRAIVDLLLVLFVREHGFSFSLWQRFFSHALVEVRVSHKKYSLQLRDAIDHAVTSLAQAFSVKNAELLWLPSISPDEFINKKITL